MAGRPPAFKSVADLQAKIDEFLINQCRPHVVKQWSLVRRKVGSTYNWAPKEVDRLVAEPVTISALCVYLDIAKDTWVEYSNKKQFSATCKRYKTKCEAYAENQLMDANGKNVVGPMFNLKANHGWVDKQVTDETQHVIIEHKNIGA